jgi:hypothetical protein
MIVQEVDGELWFFRQTDHALLSGQFARTWGNDRVPALPRREQTVVAAARHDDGWAEWELAPKLRSDGGPVDFIRVPVADHVPLYRRGIDLVESEGPYAGLVASLHGERLYTRPFHPGMDPRIQHLQGNDLMLATSYVEGERSRQQRLLGVLDDAASSDAEEDWRRLQVWDRMSLLVCMSPIREGTETTFPPIATAQGDVQIAAAGVGERVLSLDPYPFGSEGVDFDITFVRTRSTTWDHEAAFREEFRGAPHDTLRFTCVGPSATDEH